MLTLEIKMKKRTTFSILFSRGAVVKTYEQTYAPLNELAASTHTQINDTEGAEDGRQ
jgi:hypothetical protein